MRPVSFKVAKAIKEAGYPQERPLNFYVSKEYKDFTIGELYDASIDYVPIEYRVNAPAYLEVWPWLWRERKAFITADGYTNGILSSKEAESEIYDSEGRYLYTTNNSTDPEEAILAAIEYLVTNNLIK